MCQEEGILEARQIFGFDTGEYAEDCRLSKPVKYGENLKLAHDLCNTIDKQLKTALTNGED